MSDPNLEAIRWTTFAVTARDLDTLARHIERLGEAWTLTDVARFLVRRRLRARTAHARAAIAPAPAIVTPSLPLWDPAVAWQVGDWAIFAVPVTRDGVRVYSPSAGEVVKQLGGGVVVRVDGLRGVRVYGVAPRTRGNEDVERWRASVEELVAVLRDRGDAHSRIDYVLWQYGEAIFGAVQAALRQDDRFIALDGDWFVKAAAVRPNASQLAALARAMLTVEAPLTLADLMVHLPPPQIDGVRGRFGLALALSEHPGLFTPVDPGPRARWVLGGPPPVPFTARLTAYDPESYRVLCEPGEVLSDEVIERLWHVGLLHVVASPGPVSQATA